VKGRHDKTVGLGYIPWHDVIALT